jgi:hypothetical protein
MKAVARLMISYFVGSVYSKWLTVTGLLLMLGSLYVLMYLPQTEHMLALAFPGIIVFFLATSFMPLTLGRLAQSHAARILPGARIKLLASAIMTVLLVCLPVLVLTPLAYVAGMSADLSKLDEFPPLLDYTLNLALVTYTSSCIIATWMYVFMWFVSDQRNLFGAAKAMVIMLLLMILPAREIRDLNATFLGNLVQMAGLALIFSVAFLCWPKIKLRLARRGSARVPRASPTRDLAGKEVDVILGNANPWLLIVSLVLPLIAITRLGDGNISFWIFFLMISTIVSGASAGQAPARSRALWLRGDWSRSELFSAVERSTWRHTGLVLAALLLSLIVIGAIVGIPRDVLIIGVPLLILGMTLSTYLGLMITRGIRWPEGLTGAFVMLGLMGVALDAGSETMSYTTAFLTLFVLALLSVGLRLIARARWSRIDWSLCRTDRDTESRAGSWT